MTCVINFLLPQINGNLLIFVHIIHRAILTSSWCWILLLYFPPLNQINESDWAPWSISRGHSVNRWRSESSCSELINWISISPSTLVVNSLIAWRRKGTRDCSSWRALWFFPVRACLSLWYPPSAVCKTSHLYTVTSRGAFIYQVTTMQITCRRFGRSNYQTILCWVFIISREV